MRWGQPPPHSIDVGRGELEGVANDFQARFGVRGDHDFDDIEAEQDLGIVEPAQPGERTAGDTLLFLSIDRFERPAEVLTRARFYFDKDERVLIATDNVDLATGAPFEIAIENLIAVPAQEPAGQFLATRSPLEMFWWR